MICLGSGTSNGVPMIGCDCAVCTSDDPADRRTRPGIVVRCGHRVILIDTGPELRLQCIANGISRADAVLYTHHHADHVAGLDDLRGFNWAMQEAIDVYATESTAAHLQKMFRYAFEDDPEYPSSTPALRLHILDDSPIDLCGVRVVPIPLLHGPLPVLGFRFGGFAYCTDCSEIPASSLKLLEGLEVLILDAVRIRPHPTHFNLSQAVEAARRVGARRTFFTHISHELPHVQTNAELPEGMELAYDGMRLMFDE